MVSIFSLLLVILLVANPLEARSTIEEEFRNVLWKIAQYVDGYYYEQLPPDTLMHASTRGIFKALDPASEYSISQRETTLSSNFYTLMQIVQTVDSNALYSVSPDTLIRFGVAGMMEILDPYTIFMEKRNLDNFNIQTQGHYGGLGFRIQVVYPDSVIAVWSLLHEQTPAARAGVRSGDLIVAIDDSTTRFMTAGDAADAMRGVPGTPVKLTIRRAGVKELLELTINREEIHMNSVPHYTLFPDSIGYIKLLRFQSNSSAEVRSAIQDLQRQGMKSLILDLRGNGGGYLQEAIHLADLLLPKNRLVVFTAGRALPDTSRYYTQHPSLLDDEPLIVMVDRTSASASEIVAGAVQDWDLGLILGTPTAGKGSVQQTVPIGEKAELKLTMAAWHTPSGRSIDRRMRKDSTAVITGETSYKTQLLGRAVQGGGGITPDIFMPGRQATPLYNQLSGWYTLDNQFFSYTRQYHVHHPDIKPDFQSDERTLEEFRKFSETRNFRYVSEAESSLQPLEKKIEEEEDYKRLDKHLKRLLAEIDKIKEKHWKDNAELLKWKLTYDILEKNLGVRTAIAYDVNVDPQVESAREILADPQQYEKWFKRGVIGMEQDELVQEIDSVELH